MATIKRPPRSIEERLEDQEPTDVCRGWVRMLLDHFLTTADLSIRRMENDSTERRNAAATFVVPGTVLMQLYSIKQEIPIRSLSENAKALRKVEGLSSNHHTYSKCTDSYPRSVKDEAGTMAQRWHRCSPGASSSCDCVIPLLRQGVGFR
ncbi:hypothetical protein BGZ63DRAFT_370968 [Mariannaea sp. PMI_226]|nr:hypothetical protein BGZ63DRAFT_370968 [Mariannaea sp. PMI_226]